MAENVALALGRSERRGALRPAMRREKRELIAERLRDLGFGLEDRMDVPVGSLSGGQRQAVTLLMATIGNPCLLLLDEHTAALDPAATERVLELTDRIVADQKVATLMVTHDLGDALAHGTRTLVMHDGRIVADVSGRSAPPWMWPTSSSSSAPRPARTSPTTRCCSRPDTPLHPSRTRRPSPHLNASEGGPLGT